MINVITDKGKINELLTRGVENVYPSREDFEKALLSGKRLKIYCGFDPTASSLHIGNAIQLEKLSQFQALGHEIIFLIGDFTAMIGDPTDKKATRRKMTKEEVVANCQEFQKQASAYIDFEGDNPAQVMYNGEWLDKLTFADLIEIASHFTVGQMIIRDMFQKRMEENKPIHLHEFLYPLAQAYDSVVMDVDAELGGNDQMFNMMCGRDLMRAMKNKEKFVLTNKLLVDQTGKKMGKTEGNIVKLDETPENMYGQVMSWPDGVLPNAFEICTKWTMEEVENAQKEFNQPGANPRDLKMRLAYEITRINHGDEIAKAAEEYFIRTVQKKEVPDEIEEVKVGKNKWKLIDLLLEVKLASSKGEARRLIEQKGIKIAGEVAEDMNAEIEISPEGLLLQRGKRQFIKAVL